MGVALGAVYLLEYCCARALAKSLVKPPRNQRGGTTSFIKKHAVQHVLFARDLGQQFLRREGCIKRNFCVTRRFPFHPLTVYDGFLRGWLLMHFASRVSFD